MTLGHWRAKTGTAFTVADNARPTDTPGRSVHAITEPVTPAAASAAVWSRTTARRHCATIMSRFWRRRDVNSSAEVLRELPASPAVLDSSGGGGGGECGEVSDLMLLPLLQWAEPGLGYTGLQTRTARGYGTGEEMSTWRVLRAATPCRVQWSARRSHARRGDDNQG